MCHWQSPPPLRLDKGQCTIDGVMKRISMAQRKAAVTPLLTHWSYYSLVLIHRYDDRPLGINKANRLWKRCYITVLTTFTTIYQIDTKQWMPKKCIHSSPSNKYRIQPFGSNMLKLPFQSFVTLQYLKKYNNLCRLFMIIWIIIGYSICLSSQLPGRYWLLRMFNVVKNEK